MGGGVGAGAGERERALDNAERDEALARSRISLSFAEACEMETGDRRGYAETLASFNQGTALQIPRERFSPRCVVNRTAGGVWDSIHRRHFARDTFFELDSLVRIGTIAAKAGSFALDDHREEMR